MLEIIFTALLLIFILWVLFSHSKITERKAKIINMSFFSIKSIQDFIKESDLRDIFKSMHFKGWNRFLYGDPYISLEKIIHDSKTEYYIGVPKNYEEILNKNPHVLRVEKSVLPENKNYAAVCLHKGEPHLKFGEIEPHRGEEGVVLQILARHIHDGPSHFESNVRVISWADSKDRAMKILSLKKIKDRKNRRFVFDFFSRIFENKHRVKLSFGELRSFLVNKFVY